jgi:hypothetical protein
VLKSIPVVLSEVAHSGAFGLTNSCEKLYAMYRSVVGALVGASVGASLTNAQGSTVEQVDDAAFSEYTSNSSMHESLLVTTILTPVADTAVDSTKYMYPAVSLENSPGEIQSSSGVSKPGEPTAVYSKTYCPP